MEGPLRLIRAKLAQSGITDTELCAHFKVENLEDLEMLHVNAAIRFAQNGPA